MKKIIYLPLIILALVIGVTKIPVSLDQEIKDIVSEKVDVPEDYKKAQVLGDRILWPSSIGIEELMASQEEHKNIELDLNYKLFDIKAIQPVEYAKIKEKVEKKVGELGFVLERCNRLLDMKGFYSINGSGFGLYRCHQLKKMLWLSRINKGQVSEVIDEMIKVNNFIFNSWQFPNVLLSTMLFASMLDTNTYWVKELKPALSRQQLSRLKKSFQQVDLKEKIELAYKGEVQGMSELLNAGGTKAIFGEDSLQSSLTSLFINENDFINSLMKHMRNNSYSIKCTKLPNKCSEYKFAALDYIYNPGGAFVLTIVTSNISDQMVKLKKKLDSYHLLVREL